MYLLRETLVHIITTTEYQDLIIEHKEFLNAEKVPSVFNLYSNKSSMENYFIFFTTLKIFVKQKQTGTHLLVVLIVAPIPLIFPIIDKAITNYKY